MLKIDKNATINTESKIEENDDTKKINKNHKTDEEDYDDLENIR